MNLAVSHCMIACDRDVISLTDMPATRVRIFSDLHYRDTRSTLQNLPAFTPLLGDAAEIVLNGDTLDTQIAVQRESLGEVRAFFENAGPMVTFLSGNHDPNISDQAELSLGDGRVWVTHGDVFFDHIAPWSHHRAEFIRRLAVLSAGLSAEERAQVETRLRLHRFACLGLPENLELFRPGPLARARRLVHTLSPPTRILEMMRAWLSTPAAAGRLARAQRPRAQVVVLGHTHYPGVWHLPGSPRLTVINTGSFSRPFGSLFVELHGERVRVMRMTRLGDQFRPGRVVADFALTD